MLALGEGPEIAPGNQTQPARHPFLAVGLASAVAAMSTAAILVRFSSSPPTLLAAYRLALSAALLWPLALFASSKPRTLGRRERLLALLSGALLGSHYALWFASLERTSVASSAVLVTSHPLLIVPAGYLLWRERVSFASLVGMAMALAGGVMIGAGDLELGGEHLVGDLLAVLAAAAMGGHLMLGRALRAKISLFPYLALVNSFGAVVVFLFAWFSGTDLWPLPPREWLIAGLLALIPTLIGHTLLNWALRHTQAAVVSVSTLGEPVGASILAFFLFGEAPGVWQAAGSLLILVGVFLFSRQQQGVGK